jgi:hypothetical protein
VLAAAAGYGERLLRTLAQGFPDFDYLGVLDLLACLDSARSRRASCLRIRSAERWKMRPRKRRASYAASCAAPFREPSAALPE